MGMGKISILAVFLFTVFVGSSNVFAQEINPFFRGVRDEGMGGAGVATVDDETSLFINPAGLGRIRGPYIALINPELETNYDTSSALGGNLNGYMGAQDPTALLGLASKNPDKNLHVKVQLQPTFVTTNFAIGALAKYNLDAQYSAASASMQYNYINDYAAALGYCFRLWEGRIKIGLMGKVDNRVYISKTIPQGSTGLSIASLAQEGTGVGWDGGIILTAPWAMLPTLAAVVHDVGNTNFTLGNGMVYTTTTRPPPQMQQIDVGMAIFPYNGKLTRGSITAQMSNIQYLNSSAITRNLHGGVEINFADIFFIRGGYNEGYYTAGLELDIARQQIQIATYGEEIGVYPHNEEDRRYVFRYGFRF